MPIPGATLPQTDPDSFAEGVSQLPVPQGLHSQIVYGDAATDIMRKTAHAVPDILYRALSDFGQGDADTAQGSAQRDANTSVYRTGQDVPADDLNERYGVPGYLRFNEATSEEDAAWRNAQATHQQFADQVFARTKPQPLTDLGLGLAGALTDPVGLPLMLATGGLGEAVLGGEAAEGAVASAKAVSASGRIWNAAKVPLEGAISNAPYIGVSAGLSQYNGDDYSLADGLRDIAAGAVLHSAMHFGPQGLGALARGAGDMIDGSLANADGKPRFPWKNPVPPESVPDAVNNLPPAARRGAFVKALDDMIGDNPVDVGQYVDREINRPGLDRLDETTSLPAVESFRPLDTDLAITPRGTEIPVHYGLAELDDLTTSHDNHLAPNPAYPSELQPRDRARAGAQAANYDLEKNLNPKLLMTDTAAGAGAPIIAPDGVVESGNGRTIALRRSAEAGGEAYGRYVEELKARGYNVAGMRKPVLIRMRTEPMEGAQRAALAREMNSDVVERMSAVEQAMSDAARIPDQALTAIPDQFGGITGRDFARGFIAKVAPDQVNSFTDSQGRLSPEGARRIKAAVLARAYEDPSLVGQMFEGDETHARQIAEGLADAAPAWAKMRAAARAGEIPRELDLTPHLTAAMDLIRGAREAGEKLGTFLAERLGQKDMFAGEAIRPETEALLRLMFKDATFSKPESAETIAAALKDYARQASKVTPGENLFGETADEGTARQILDNLASRYANGQTSDLESVRPIKPEKSGKPERAGKPKPKPDRPSVIDLPEPGAEGDGGGEGVPAGDSGPAGEAGTEPDAAGRRYDARIDQVGDGKQFFVQPSHLEDAPGIFGHIDGDSWRIESAQLPEGARGQGEGIALYERTIQEAFDNGAKALTSDAEITPDAAKIYEALAKRGYRVEKNPEAFIRERDGKLVTPDHEPVFRVLPGGAAERQASARTAAAVRALIAADPELKALAESTEQLAAEAGIEPSTDTADAPDTIAKAVEALQQCMLGAAEEVL